MRFSQPSCVSSPSSECVSVETTDAARLRLAARFLSSLSLHPQPRKSRDTSPSHLAPTSRARAASPSGPITVRPISGEVGAGASWQAAAALDFLSKLRLTSRHQNEVGGASNLPMPSSEAQLQKEATNEINTVLHPTQRLTRHKSSHVMAEWHDFVTHLS